MGLPRYLADGFKAQNDRFLTDHANHLEHVAFACADLAPKVFEVANKEKWNKPTSRHVINCAVAFRFKWFALTTFRSFGGDATERVDAKLYLGLEERNGGVAADFRDVKVGKFFVAKLGQINKDREAADRKQLDLLKRIQRVQNKVYASRIFPTTLRVIIFERDGYACKCCGRDRQSLFALGLALQVDHIVAWEDGGKTTYANGQTLCDECNIAKHHAKSYLHAKHMLRQVGTIA